MTQDGKISYQYWEGDDHCSRLRKKYEEHEIVDATNDDNYWTQISKKKFKFRIPFFDDVNRYNRELIECSKYVDIDNYIDNYLLNENRTGHSKYNHRGMIKKAIKDFAKKNILSESDKTNIIDMVNEEDKLKVQPVLNKKERNPEEKELYTDALKRSGYIHHLGNMCLLSNVDNILNGCGFYDEKRTKILKRIKNGGFIPSHTIEVFTKSIFNENPGDFTRWNKLNIDKHKEIIENSISNLTTLFKEESKNESR